MNIRQKRCLLLACLLTLSTMIPLLTGCSTKAAAAAPAAPGGAQQAQASTSISVATVAPTVETLSLTTNYIGTIESAESVSIYPAMSGTVSAVYFEAGQKVKKGDLLFELDAASATLSLEQAKVAYDLTVNSINVSANGSTNELTELTYQNKLKAALNTYNTARETLELLAGDSFDVKEYAAAKKALNAAADAYASNHTDALYTAYQTAQKNYDAVVDCYSDYYTAVTNVENTYNDLEAVRKEYAIYQSQITTEDTTSNQLKLKQAELAYQSAQKTMENTKIYSPIGGTIESKSISMYGNVSSNTAAYTISNQNAIAVGFNISADGIAALSIGDDVTLTKGATTYKATITEMDSKASSTGLFPVTASITGDSKLLSGVSVKVSACTAKAENALVVSIDDINYEDSKPYVYLYKDGTATKTFIEVGITTSDKAEVKSGLDTSAKIITTWHPDLADGVAVSLKV